MVGCECRRSAIGRLALLSCLLFAAGAATPARAANLVRNGSFEVGTFAYWAHNAAVGIDQFMYHRTGTRSVAVSGDLGFTTQRVSVAAFAALIDADGASVTTGCYHAGYEPVYVTATFLDAGGKVLSGKSAAGTPPMSFATWKKLALTRTPIPPATRSIRLKIRVKDVPDGMADTSWDDAFMVVVNR